VIVAAVADTHGKTELIIKELRLLNPDHILFAGDYYDDGQKIFKVLKIPGNSVAGNCDISNRMKQEEIISLMGYKIFLVHGHQFGVKRDLNRLKYRAQELAVDAVVFGHTHSPFCDKIGDLWLINPGSAAHSRWSGQGSFAIIEIDNHGLKPSIKNLAQG
jgi:putative phosphoesterase